jgi:hypothetical protein
MLYLMEVGEDVFEMMKMDLLNDKMNCGSLRCPWGRKERRMWRMIVYAPMPTLLDQLFAVRRRIS